MPEFKFSLISDMHVDFPQPKTPYADLEQFVIVAGDTSNGLGGLKFLTKLKNKGFDVFAIDGNHEHYANLSQDRKQIETETGFYASVGDPERRIADLLIVGANGWYRVTDEPQWYAYMNDSRNGRVTADEVNLLARNDAAYISQRLAEHNGKAIVVTHTAPCEETLDERYFGYFSNEWYWNPHMRQVLADHRDKILVWCHGHTHSPADKIVDGVRVVCNPRGYPGENPNWKPKTVEVVW